jgi:plastocyanin
LARGGVHWGAELTRGIVSSVMIPHTTHGIGLAVVTAALVAGCGAEDRQAPDPSTLELSKPEDISGDVQVGIAGKPLPDSLRVLVTRDGEPVEGVTVTWFTTEGAVTPGEVRTGPDGLAATTWTTKALYAEQFAAATIDGGPTIGFTAIATPDPEAPNTILVRSEEGGRFEPAELAVLTGETVDWLWTPGSFGHNIVPDDAESPPHSGAPADWPKWHVFTFTRPGVYRYHCSVHGAPNGVGMSGTITVSDPGEQ